MRKPKAGIFTLSTSSIIICECLNSIVTIFLDTFLVSKILKLTPGNYSGIAYFNFMYYILIALTNFALAPLLKKINKSFVLSLGALSLAGLFVTVYLMGDSIINWIWLLGAVSGIGTGLFNAAFNNLVSEVISSKHQTIYFSVKNVMIFLTKTVFPLILGSIIDLGSFPLMCVIVAVICILIFTFSFFIKSKKKEVKSFNLIKYIKLLKTDKEDTKPLKMLYLSAVFRGLCFDIIATVFTVLIFLSSAGSDFKIGLIQTIFTATQLIATFIFMKFYHKHRAAKFIFGALGLIIAASIPVFITQNIYTILIIFGVYTFFRLFVTTITDMRRPTIIRQLSMHSHSLEHNTLYSLIYGFVRAISYFLFMLYVVMPEALMLNIILAINLTAYVGYGICLYIMEKQLIQQDIKWKLAHPEVEAVNIETKELNPYDKPIESEKKTA